MAPSNGAVVTDIPVAVDLGWVRTGGNVEIGCVHAIDRYAGRVPGVDIGSQVGRLPAERACAIIGKRSSDGGCHRAAGSHTNRGRNCGCRGAGHCAGHCGGQGGPGGSASRRLGRDAKVTRQAIIGFIGFGNNIGRVNCGRGTAGAKDERDRLTGGQTIDRLRRLRAITRQRNRKSAIRRGCADIGDYHLNLRIIRAYWAGADIGNAGNRHIR